MQIDVCGLSFKLTGAIEHHVEGRVKLALGPASESVNGVMVRLRDTNGARGGVDKGCRVVVWLRGRGAVVVDTVAPDLYAAVDAAAAKLREAVRRQLRRRRTLRREYANRRLRRPSA